MSVHREQIIQQVLKDVRVGMPVRTSDGAEIGLVKEIAGDFIKIDAPLRADYWLSADYVLGGNDNGVELSFAKSDLNAYKRDKPDVLEGEDPLRSEATVDVIITEDEQMEQRVRMERELAEQRRDLPHTHPEGEDAPPDTGGTLGEPVEVELERIDPEGAPAHDDDADDTDEAPDFMTKSDARAVVGLEPDSPLVPPVDVDVTATYGEPPSIGVVDDGGTRATRALDAAGQRAEAERPDVASALTREHASAELQRVESEGTHEPPAATPASPSSSPQLGAWTRTSPYAYTEATTPSPLRRIAMLGVGVAILLGVGVGGYAVRRRIKHRHWHHS